MTILQVANFFIRLEEAPTHEGALWVVWGSPHRKHHNRTLIKAPVVQRLKEWLEVVAG